MERLTLRDDDGRALLTPYGLRIYCSTQATADCICKLEEALKAQEPVKPKKNDVELAGLRTWDWACPKCDCILVYRANYCSCCGRAVKWE